MAQRTATKTASGRKRAQGAKGKKAAAPVDRLDDAIASAQDALKDLRGDLRRGRKDLVKDLDKTLKDARSNLRRMRRTLVDDLEDVGASISGRDGKRKTTARSRSTTRRSTTAKARPRQKAKA